MVKQKNYIISSNDTIKYELVKHEILKVSIYEPNFKLYEKVRKEIQEIYDFAVVSSDINYLDVNVKNTNKATRVRDLVKYLGIELSETICIGDNENNIEMIKEAGLGVAMANSCKKLIDFCDIITESNDNCGVAKVINKYII